MACLIVKVDGEYQDEGSMDFILERDLNSLSEKWEDFPNNTLCANLFESKANVDEMKSFHQWILNKRANKFADKKEITFYRIQFNYREENNLILETTAKVMLYDLNLNK